jgi:hypothetical protein
MIRWSSLCVVVCLSVGCKKASAPLYSLSEPAPPSQAPSPMMPAEDRAGASTDVTLPGPQRAERMVHYDGWVRSRVADPRLAVEEVVAIAADLGGRTDRMQGSTVTVRIPVDAFDEAWERVLAVGDVMDRSVRADDVTEAFTAIELRARTLRETQKRLIELLGKAKEEEEKLRLLQQITQVSEELDRIESQLRVLGDLAAMSRIHAEFVPRQAFTAGGGRPALDGFDWIAALSPFNRSVLDDDKRIEVPVPDGLVSLSPRGPFVAESADGAVVWTMRVANDPVGDAAYWRSVIEERVADDFRAVEPLELGGWRCLAMSEPGAEAPYRWEVCVRTVGNKVHVAQVFAPGPEQVERYGEAVHAALAAAGGGA